MRYTTSRRYEFGLKSHIPVTTLHLDCGDTFTYFGDPESAEKMLRENGGAMTGIGTVCRECHQRQQATVRDIIQQARKAAGL